MTTSALWRCFGLYRRHPWWLAAALLLTALANVLMPATQWLVQHAIDHGLLAGAAAGNALIATAPLTSATTPAAAAAALTAAWPWLMVLLGLAVARGVLAWFATVVAMMHGQLMLYHLRRDLYAAALTLDLDFHRRHGVGELVARTTRDSDQVRDALTGGFRTIVEVAMVSVGALGLLWWYHPLLAIVPAGLLIISTLWLVRHARAIEELNRRAGLAYDRMAQDLDEGVRGVRVIKAFALEDLRLKHFARHVGVLARRQFAAARAAALRLPAPQLLVALGQVWVLGCGAWLVADGRLSIGALTAASMAILMVVFRVENIGRVMQIFAAAQASAVRVRAIIDAVPQIRTGNADLPAGALGLRWQGVTKRYGEAGEAGVTAILDRLDLTIVPGEIVAVVGITGSGKSTLALLAARCADPDVGTVSIGGGESFNANVSETWHDLRSLKLDALRRAVQILPQEALLFSATLRENLRLANPTATDAELQHALNVAAATDIVAQIPGGLDARVGERGVTVSGGQRQRLCLARALVAQPRILIADDATSALDTITEAQVLNNLRQLGCTVLLIASRLSTVTAADRVCLLSNGTIVDHGSHAQLRHRRADYRELLALDQDQPALPVS